MLGRSRSVGTLDRETPSRKLNGKVGPDVCKARRRSGVHYTRNTVWFAKASGGVHSRGISAGTSVRTDPSPCPPRLQCRLVAVRTLPSGNRCCQNERPGTKGMVSNSKVERDGGARVVCDLFNRVAEVRGQVELRLTALFAN